MDNRTVLKMNLLHISSLFWWVCSGEECPNNSEKRSSIYSLIAYWYIFGVTKQKQLVFVLFVLFSWIWNIESNFLENIHKYRGEITFLFRALLRPKTVFLLLSIDFVCFFFTQNYIKLYTSGWLSTKLFNKYN